MSVEVLKGCQSEVGHTNNPGIHLVSCILESAIGLDPLLRDRYNLPVRSVNFVLA